MVATVLCVGVTGKGLGLNWGILNINLTTAVRNV
jgi:hypothetical protein